MMDAHAPEFNEANGLRLRGVDVVVEFVETHGCGP
jgi:K+-sensing histidine kinase KdpD